MEISLLSLKINWWDAVTMHNRHKIKWLRSLIYYMFVFTILHSLFSVNVVAVLQVTLSIFSLLFVCNTKETEPLEYMSVSFPLFSFHTLYLSFIFFFFYFALSWSSILNRWYIDPLAYLLNVFRKHFRNLSFRSDMVNGCLYWIFMRIA